MNFVITGAAGNISHHIVKALLKEGHQVSVIGRDATRLEELTMAGANALIGNVEDREFLKDAFKDADAVYTMVPPNFAATDWVGYIGSVGENYAYALKENGIKYVVNLSSVGAHLETGAGPVSGLYRLENALNSVEGINILHLRPGYFYQNFLNQTGMVKHMDILGANLSKEIKMVLADPKDIADAAVNALLKPEFKGVAVEYIASDERLTTEIASVLGEAVGKPELPWVEFTDEQYLEGALQAGLPEEIAKKYTEMGRSLNSGVFFEEFVKSVPTRGNVKLEDFAKQFAEVYASTN